MVAVASVVAARALLVCAVTIDVALVVTAITDPLVAAFVVCAAEVVAIPCATAVVALQSLPPGCRPSSLFQIFWDSVCSFVEPSS